MDKMKKKQKKALSSFILGIVAMFVVSMLTTVFGMVGSVFILPLFAMPLCFLVGAILNIIGLACGGAAKGVDKNPGKVFRVIGLVMNGLGLAWNILMGIGLFLVFLFLGGIIALCFIFMIVMLIITIAPIILQFVLGIVGSLTESSAIALLLCLL